MKRVAEFASESELCTTFIEEVKNPSSDWSSKQAPKWQAYPESGGFDILLVRIADGFQIGIEAKLHLNQSVLQQALEAYPHDPCSPGPNCRAVLVPDGSGREPLSLIAPFCGITIIRCRKPETERGVYRPVFRPSLPRPDEGYWAGREWFEQFPTKLLALPEYVPDVAAGASAPLQLTPWKISALKIAVLIDRRGFVVREDFKHLQIDHRRWIGSQWLVADEKGRGWMKGPYWPDFARQHPTNFKQVAADFEKWQPPALAAQGPLL